MKGSVLLNISTFLKTVIVFCAIVIQVVGSISIVKINNNMVCGEVSNETLSEVLGGAFNERYMSIDTPQNSSATEEETIKRRAPGESLAFYVEPDFRKEFGNEPAWPRRKRSELSQMKSDPSEKWKCQSKLLWIDLGIDYFPRFLRTVECEKKSCWYGLMKCKPRSFTVKLLRRKRDRCVVAEIGTSLGLEGLPIDLREFWVWEERAVTFCCDCSV